MNRKIKVLVVGEFSELSTGFSTYFRYLMPRLYNDPRFEIAQFAMYINKYHPGIDKVPWKVYPNEPDPNNPEEIKQYNSNPINQFGAWKFEQVCLDFKCDVVLNISDPWMSSFINASPLRKNFKYIHCPTCDGQMQKWDWLADYSECDALLTYTEWAKNTLEKQSGGKLKVFSAVPAGADLEVFCPAESKKIAKTAIGLKDNIFLVQTVMRNQPRKLYPEILKGFTKFLDICKEKGNLELANKTYMYWHTSFPDVGWNIPEELRLHGLSHKVIFSYMCDHCGVTFAQFWNGDVCTCRNCGNMTCHLPNTANGVSREVLAKIHQAADIYIQYSSCEGQGLPAGDALSTGTPIMAVDNSGMTEALYYGKGIPIKVGRHFQEPFNQTNQVRALPDNDDFAKNLYEFLTLPQSERDKMGLEARHGAETHFNWERIAGIWKDAILSLDYPDQKETWYGPPKLIKPNTNIPNGLTNEQFVEWCYTYILHRPRDILSEMAQKAISALNLGYEIHQNPNGIPQKVPITRDIILNNMLRIVNDRNNVEKQRYELVTNQIQSFDTNRVGYVEL